MNAASEHHSHVMEFIVKPLKMTINLGLLGLLAAAAFSGAASAQPCTTASFSAYLTGPCTVGDKTFSDFAFDSTAGGSGVALTSDDVTVAPELTADGPGLLFSSSAITVTQGTPITLASFVDVVLGYTVTAGSGFQIDDADLVIAGGTDGAGQGNVTDFLTASSSGTSLPLLSVALPATTDMVTFPMVDAVDVFKDILVEVPAGGIGSANITTVSQPFSQSAIPEPPTLALLSVGLLGFATARLRRRR